MTNTGHIQEQYNDDNGYLQFEVKCFGPNDNKKYLVLDGFGSAYMPPINTRALVAGSANKDDNFVIGVLNKIDISVLSNGERILLSTNADGSEVMSQIIQRNTGKIEIITKSDVDITSDGNVNITATQFNVNSGNLTVD